MQTMRLFHDVASCRSFSAAALRHGITQSAASQRVLQLEKRLGVTLIDRSTRPLSLTPAGQAYFRGVRDLIERHDRLERQVGRLALEPAGQVLVEAIYSAGIDLLNQVKERFEAAHPRVKVTVQYKRPEAVYQAVRDHQCDLGIVSYPQRWPEVGVVPLRNEPMGVVCAPGHALAARKTVSAAELGGWDMAGFEASLPLGRHLRRYLKQHGVKPRLTSQFDNVDTVKNAVTMTGQIAILPWRTVRREVAAGTLCLLALEPELVRPLGVIYPRASRLRAPGHGPELMSPAAQAFVDFLVEHADGGAEPPERPSAGGVPQSSGQPMVGAST